MAILNVYLLLHQQAFSVKGWAHYIKLEAIVGDVTIDLNIFCIALLLQLTCWHRSHYPMTSGNKTKRCLGQRIPAHLWNSHWDKHLSSFVQTTWSFFWQMKSAGIIAVLQIASQLQRLISYKCWSLMWPNAGLLELGKACNISATAGAFCNPLLKTAATHTTNMWWGLMLIKSDMLWSHYNLFLAPNWRKKSPPLSPKKVLLNVRQVGRNDGAVFGSCWAWSSQDGEDAWLTAPPLVCLN